MLEAIISTIAFGYLVGFIVIGFFLLVAESFRECEGCKNNESGHPNWTC